jgi:AcrR family transcriptional regulator
VREKKEAGTMGKVDTNKLKKRQSLLDTAFQLFTTKGFSKTSISDIVERAGVAKGTFYLYFKDKYDLRDRLIAHKTGQIFRHALEYSGYENEASFSDKFIALLDNVLEQFSHNPELLRFINKNLSWGIFSRALMRASEDEQEIQHILTAEAKGIREPRIMLYTIVELVGASCHSVILEQDPVDLTTYKPYLYQSVRAIIDSFRMIPEENR